MQVIVIGGGIAGLSAAYELASRGVEFVLLEASNRTGGLIFTERVDGYTIDAGADSLLVQKAAGLQLCDELELTSRLIATSPPRSAYIHARGQLYSLPAPSVFGIPTTSIGAAKYTLLSWPDRLRLAAGLLRRGSNRDSTDDESVGSFYRRKFGTATVDLIAAPLLGSIHAGDVERLSIRSVAPRLLDPDSFARAAPCTGSDGGGLFRSFTGGMGELVAAIEQRLPPGSVRLASDVATAARTKNGWRVVGSSGTFDARAVIIAAPAHAAARIVSAADSDLAALCGEVPYVSTACVALAWPRSSVAHPLHGSGFVVAPRHSSLRITACTWVSSKWRDRAPEGMVLLRAFLGRAGDPDAAALSNEELIAVATRDLTTALGIRGAPALVRVQRWIRAGAQHIVGHTARVTRIEARLAGLPGLFVAGSGFRAIGVPDCIADGRAAGQKAARYVKITEC